MFWWRDGTGGRAGWVEAEWWGRGRWSRVWKVEILGRVSFGVGNDWVDGGRRQWECG